MDHFAKYLASISEFRNLLFCPSLIFFYNRVSFCYISNDSSTSSPKLHEEMHLPKDSARCNRGHERVGSEVSLGGQTLYICLPTTIFLSRGICRRFWRRLSEDFHRTRVDFYTFLFTHVMNFLV